MAVNLGSTLGNIDFVGGLVNIIVYMIYGVVIMVIAAVIGAFLYVAPYKFRATEFNLVGSGSTDGLGIGTTNKNRFKWNKAKTAWKPLKPYFNKKEIKPVDPKFIYHGKKVYMFKHGEDYIPGSINISKEEGEMVADIDPVPHSLRSWSALEDERIEMEFQKQDFWSQNKNMLMIIATVGICGAVCVATIWLTYKFSTAGVSATQGLTAAIQNIGVID